MGGSSSGSRNRANNRKKKLLEYWLMIERKAAYLRCRSSALRIPYVRGATIEDINVIDRHVVSVRAPELRIVGSPFSYPFGQQLDSRFLHFLCGFISVWADLLVSQLGE